MKISSTGDGLNVLITCDFLPHHHWMTFATWYSINKLLPDSKIGISCTRGLGFQLYDWVKTLKIKMKYHDPKEDITWDERPLLIVQPDIVMVREWEPIVEDVVYAKDICCDVKEEEAKAFVSYGEGWGNFVTSSWINKPSSPFQYKFGKAEMTSNEVRVEKLWKQLLFLYQTVSRG